MQQSDSHTGSDTRIHVSALLNMRHKDCAEARLKQPETIRHDAYISCRCSSEGTQSRGKEFTVLRSADHMEPQARAPKLLPLSDD